MDPGAEFLGCTGHGLAHSATSATGMEDPVLVFDEREDGEQTGAPKRRHAQVLALEREREPDPWIVEIGPQVLIDTLPGPQEWQHFEEREPQ